jgi:hypothetical protein
MLTIMTKYLKYGFSLLLVIVTASSCKKYLDVNENPNSPTRPPLNGLLAQVTEETGINVYRVGDNVGNYVQYLASSNTASPFDIFEPIDASTIWTELYNTMTDIYDMDKLGKEMGSTAHQGVAKILMAINLKMVHDLWGAAPYTEAFSSESLTPKFDSAQVLYQKCLSLTDEGIALLKQQGSVFALDKNLDFIHQGNVSAWIKTAYALKARLLNQVSKRPEYNPDAILTALASAYTSTADDAKLTTFDVRNPWAQVALDNKNLVLGGWLSEYYINAMNGATFGIFDPRLPLITDTTRYGDYRGTRNGKGRTGSGVSYEENYLSTTKYYSSDNSPLYIITYEECKFIEAEAALRKNDKTRAYNAYLEGIRANMNTVGVSAAARDAYLNQASVAVGSANITLDLIMKEKYKALFLSPETWNDARRYDYKYLNFLMPLNAATTTFIRRFVYPSVETSRNGANTPKVTDVTQRLWWDQ